MNRDPSIRMLIAIEAMKAIIAKNPAMGFSSLKDVKEETEAVALGAFVYADAMLAASEKNAPKQRRTSR